MSYKENRLRLCDSNKKKLPLIKDQLREKIPKPWFTITEKELNRIRRPFESYVKELLEEGYPESSVYLSRVLEVKKEDGLTRVTTLIDDKALLDQTISCFKNLEECERNECSTTEAMDSLILLSEKMTGICEGVAEALYEIILEKLTTTPCADFTKCKGQYSFGKFLFKIKDYEKANSVLKETLKHSEENNFDELLKSTCKVLYDALYQSCLSFKSTDTELATKLATESKDIAVKLNDSNAITQSLIERGNLLMSMQNYNEAISDFEAASLELKKVPNLDLKVEVLYKLSTCYFTIENYDNCLLTLGALGRLATVYKKSVYQAHFGRIDGNVKLLMGEIIKAHKNFIKSIEIYDNIGLREYATSCRFLQAIAECEYLISPWIALIIDGEKDRPFEDRFEFNKSKILVFNWKLNREYFCKTMN